MPVKLLHVTVQLKSACSDSFALSHVKAWNTCSANVQNLVVVRTAMGCASSGAASDKCPLHGGWGLQLWQV